MFANFNTDPMAVELFTDPLFIALTSCVMERVPPGLADVLPQQYLVDYVTVYEYIDDDQG